MIPYHNYHNWEINIFLSLKIKEACGLSSGRWCSISIFTLVSSVSLCVLLRYTYGMNAEDSRSWCYWLEPRPVLPPERQTECWLYLFFLQAKTSLDNNTLGSFLPTYHLTDWGRAVLALAFWERHEIASERCGVMLTRNRHSGRNTHQKWIGCARMYVSVFECVPQWCCRQQCPGTAVWTKDRPGAQVTDESGHRLTSHTAWDKVQAWLWRHGHGPPHVCKHTHTLTAVVLWTAAVGCV